MGLIRGRVKGITFRYAGQNIYSYHNNDLLSLVPEPNNPYDKNAVAIYDSQNHHIGYVGKEINAQVLDIINNKDYTCRIIGVYYDNYKPSIEYEINYFEKSNVNDFNPYDIFGDDTSVEDVKKINIDSQQGNNITNKSIDFDSIIEDATKLLDEGQFKDAIALLDDYLEYNNSDVFLYQGYAYYSIGNKNSLNAALKLFHKAYDLGNVKAALSIAQILIDFGKDDESYQWLKLAADNGFVEAYNNLGNCYAKGRGTDINPRLAFVCYKRSADAVFLEGIFNVALCYENGEGVVKNTQKALDYYEKAASIGDYDALFNMGFIYCNDIDGQRDLEKALECFEEYTDSCPDDPDGYYNLGKVYLLLNEYNLAIENFIETFELGSYYAAIDVGLIYLHINNKVDAKKWFTKALSLGLEEAENYLEDCE